MSMALDDKQQGHDDEQLPELAEPRSTAEVAEALQASGMVDELLAQIDTGQIQITGFHLPGEIVGEIPALRGVTYVGPAEAETTLYEFFDYNCGYCRKALGDVQALIKSDPKLRVVIKDFPVLGPESLEASQVAIAVRQQLKGDKLFEFHQKLLESKGRVNGARAIQVAKDLAAKGEIMLAGSGSEDELIY